MRFLWNNWCFLQFFWIFWDPRGKGVWGKGREPFAPRTMKDFNESKWKSDFLSWISTSKWIFRCFFNQIVDNLAFYWKIDGYKTFFLGFQWFDRKICGYMKENWWFYVFFVIFWGFLKPKRRGAGGPRSPCNEKIVQLSKIQEVGSSWQEKGFGEKGGRPFAPIPKKEWALRAQYCKFFYYHRKNSGAKRNLFFRWK